MDERLVRLFVDASREAPVSPELIRKVRRLRDLHRTAEQAERDGRAA
jgi:hypothetical protein